MRPGDMWCCSVTRSIARQRGGTTGEGMYTWAPTREGHEPSWCYHGSSQGCEASETSSKATGSMQPRPCRAQLFRQAAHRCTSHPESDNAIRMRMKYSPWPVVKELAWELVTPMTGVVLSPLPWRTATPDKQPPVIDRETLVTRGCTWAASELVWSTRGDKLPVQLAKACDCLVHACWTAHAHQAHMSGQDCIMGLQGGQGRAGEGHRLEALHAGCRVHGVRVEVLVRSEKGGSARDSVFGAIGAIHWHAPYQGFW